jgi:hypothetical protein
MQVTPLFLYVEIIFSVLFLGYVAARKRTKKNGEFRVSPLRRRLGALPQDPASL